MSAWSEASSEKHMRFISFIKSGAFGGAALLILLLLGSLPVEAQQSSTTSSGLASLLKPKDEFLKPDEAFQLTAHAISPDAVEVEWQIAKGYYLYRKRMGFSTDAPQLKLGDAQFPTGQFKNDEF